MINSHWSADLGFRYRARPQRGDRRHRRRRHRHLGAAARDRLRREGQRQAHLPRDLRLVRRPLQRGADRQQQQRRQPRPAARRLHRPGRARAATSLPGFNPANYRRSSAQFPTANVFFEDGLSSPIVEGVHRVVRRRPVQRPRLRSRAPTCTAMSEPSSRTSSTSTTARPTSSSNGFDVGTFTNIVYRNTDDALAAVSTACCSRAATTSTAGGRSTATTRCS